tara:strand:- start:1823 stop:2476 length:654 start_codon:yes stop_codon:yes gene_type:complete
MNSQMNTLSPNKTGLSNLQWQLHCLDELDKFTDAQTQIKAAKFLQSIVRTKLGEFKPKQFFPAETSSKKPKNNHRGPAIDKLSDGTKDPSAYVAQIEAGFSKTRITKVSSKKPFYKYKKQAQKNKPPNPTIFVPVPPSNEQLLKNIRIKLAVNPKNKGTKSWHRYEAYQHATTLYEYLYAGGGGGNGDYKYDFAEGNLSIHPGDEWWSQPIPEPIFD